MSDGNSKAEASGSRKQRRSSGQLTPKLKNPAYPGLPRTLDVDWLVQHWAAQSDRNVDDAYVDVPTYYTTRERDQAAVKAIAAEYASDLHLPDVENLPDRQRADAVTALLFMPRAQFEKWATQAEISDLAIGDLFRVSTDLVEVRRKLFEQGL